MCALSQTTRGEDPSTPTATLWPISWRWPGGPTDANSQRCGPQPCTLWQQPFAHLNTSSLGFLPWLFDHQLAAIGRTEADTSSPRGHCHTLRAKHARRRMGAARDHCRRHKAMRVHAEHWDLAGVGHQRQYYPGRQCKECAWCTQCRQGTLP